MAAAAAVGMISGGSWIQSKDSSKKKKATRKNDKVMVCSVSASAVSDPYKTLRIKRGASESEVKKAFRKLALEYHPDVCEGSNCGVQFHSIYEAYDTVMSRLRGESAVPEPFDEGVDEPEYQLWEEWMGWEGGGIRDYSSHVNPYIS